MYRKFNQSQIVQHVSIYSSPEIKVLEDLSYIKDFLDEPNLKKLIEILTNKNVKKEAKQAVLVALNTSLNYTSLKPFLNDKSTLYYLLCDIPLKPIYSFSQIESITDYIISKSRNTNFYSGLQTKAVKKILEQMRVEYFLSSNGFNDVKWSENSANADGFIRLENGEIIFLYLRYGSATGGAQNDRYRNMFDTARKNPDRKFIFIVDGTECLLQYGLCEKIIKDSQYPNAIWVTAKLLPYVDFESFKII